MIDWSQLDSGFAERVQKVIEEVNAKGYNIKPIVGLRPPDEQAKLFRQSRSSVEVLNEIQKLEERGAKYLAGVLEGVGPQSGPWATNALPGDGWHQWGEALDVAAFDPDGRYITDGSAEPYVEFANAAVAAGLTSGMFWTTAKDNDHVQLRKDASPISSGLTWSEIDAEMQKRFGGK